MTSLHILVPGSHAAREHDCICDPQEPTIVDDPGGQPLRRYRCEPVCPIHGMAVAYALFHEDP